MNRMKYYLIKFLCRILCKSSDTTCETINKFYIKKGVNIGKECKIYSYILNDVANLITIGNNVTISYDVSLITHDNSICKVLPEYTDIFGRITIKDNCFIGAKSIILPGVTIGRNVIVGAGSVVTKSIEDDVVVAGNPARVISSINKFKEQVNIYGINYNLLLNKSELINLEYKFIKK